MDLGVPAGIEKMIAERNKWNNCKTEEFVFSVQPLTHEFFLLDKNFYS